MPRKRKMLFITGLIMLGVTAVLLAKTYAPSHNHSASITMAKPHTILALQAQPNTETWAKDWWLPRHRQKLAEIARNKNNIDLVFLGDSITHAWEGPGKYPWQQYYASRNALNLGFSGDRTEHVLWRLQNGQFESMQPKVVVLMIGTNNTGHRQDKPEHTAQGIKAIIDLIHSKSPTTKILLLAIFPRGETKHDPLRQINEATNTIIRQFANNKTIFWQNINHVFLTENNMLTREVADDFLHPNASEYPKWAGAIEPFILQHF